MHVKAKKMAFGGLLLALTVICMMLGSVIESNTLFLLAAASFFVGIVIREFGFGTGTAFYLASVLLGFILAPNKFYVISYAAMGLYILVIEFVWGKLGRFRADASRRVIFWVIKYIVFNILYLPVVFGFQELLFTRELPPFMLAGVIIAGQAGLYIYDKAYEYVQGHIWNKVRGRLQ